MLHRNSSTTDCNVTLTCKKNVKICSNLINYTIKIMLSLKHLQDFLYAMLKEVMLCYL